MGIGNVFVLFYSRYVFFLPWWEFFCVFYLKCVLSLDLQHLLFLDGNVSFYLQYFFSFDGNCVDIRYFHLVTLAANSIYSFHISFFIPIFFVSNDDNADNYDDDDDGDDDDIDDDGDIDGYNRRGCRKCLRVKKIPINLLSAFASKFQSASNGHFYIQN